MSRKGENIYKRKDGRWEARYIHHYEGNKPKYCFLYGKTYAEVRAKKHFALTMQVPAPDQATASVEQIAKLWLADIHISVKESTFTRYHRTVCKYILPQLGAYPLQRIDSIVVNHFTDQMLLSGGVNGGPLSPKTVSDILCTFKTILCYGEAKGFHCGNLTGIRYPQKTPKRIEILGEDTRAVLENLLMKTEDRTSLGILIALFTGVRIGELCGLRWGDIDLDSGIITVQQTVERITDLNPANSRQTKVILSAPKTEHGARTIPIPTFLLERLKAFKQPEQYYILTGKTNFAEPHTFYVKYKGYMKRHNLKSYSFHALRHTFATRCVEVGFDAKSLAEILGHANIATTLSVYVHPTIAQKRLQMERLTPVGLCREGQP